jgi:DUF4097 and DUF4098 domain-containing protein YvlB
MRHEFQTPTAPRLSVRVPAGRVDIGTGDVSATTVDVEALSGSDEDVRVEQHGDEIRIEARRRLGPSQEYAVRIHAPHGSDADVDTATADVRARGRLGTLTAKAASAEVEAEHVDGEARVRSASGDVTLRSVGGRADVNTASGDVELGSVGEVVSVRTASGDVQVGEAAGDVSVYTASGDQEIGSVVEGSVDLKSASGEIRIGIRRGSRMHVDARSMSGETTSELELGEVAPDDDGPLVELRAVTMSGDIRVVRA